MFIALKYNDHAVHIPQRKGTISTFGGPNDETLRPREMDWAERFRVRDLGTPAVNDGNPWYCAMRWFEGEPPKAFRGETIWNVKAWYNDQRVVACYGDRAVVLWVADWGPGIRDRAADISPQAAAWLGVKTDLYVVQFGWTVSTATPGRYMVINNRIVEVKD